MEGRDDWGEIGLLRFFFKFRGLIKFLDLIELLMCLLYMVDIVLEIWLLNLDLRWLIFVFLVLIGGFFEGGLVRLGVFLKFME